MKFSLLMCAFLLAHSHVSLAAEETPQFTHAMFADGKRSMQNLIEFPNIGFDVEVTVTCAGHASAKGRLRGARCSAPNDPELKFTMAVSRRFNSTRLVPATVNGKKEEVDFQFAVIFRKEGEIESHSIYLHNMKNVERLGLDYVGAQRYSVHPWPRRCGDSPMADLIMEVAVVNDDGTPKEFDILSANFALTETCREGFSAHLKNGRWIPALSNGEFTESVWANPRINSSVRYKRQQ
jgi:hypothetical protein